ncbi:glycosyltransferase [Nakamurella sp.]|uniref:glycosyltransferase n=1 Tax=Nakamurella sp. TaxID=1869182 RepID=UPI003B3A8E54
MLMSLSLTDALAQVRDAPFLLDAIRSSDALTEAAGRDGGPVAVKLLGRAIEDTDDQLTAIAAVHGLGAVFDDGAAARLSGLLSDPRTFLREHAAWALGSRSPRLDAIGRLVAGVAAGGFATVINQRALRRWAQLAPDHIALALEGALLSRDDAAGRARLIDTLGLVPGPISTAALLRIAADEREPLRPRQAAVAALGDRPADPGVVELVTRLAAGSGELAGVARLAAFDLAGPTGERVGGGSGLAVAQMFLHADLDRELSRAGAGDNGGIATMLVRLGDALADEPGIDRVLTLSRGSVEAAVAALDEPAEAHVLAPVPLLSEPTDAANAWPLAVAAERGIRRALTAHGRVDVLHLRMADVGSMAAAAVAARLGIPTVFTLAPDPHAVIHALDMTGALTRGTFGTVDEREHYWFRTDLVARLAAGAQHRVLFPRPNLRSQLRDLLGLDIDGDLQDGVDGDPERSAGTPGPGQGGYSVVPEGIDITVAARALDDVRAAAHPALTELAELVAALPEHRRGLPLAVSVGRLHRVKGMATVVEAWASDPTLPQRCNLLIVGGDLAEPSVDEREQLGLIAGVVDRHPAAAGGLLLPGHRPNDVVARWMAAAHLGLPGVIAPGGAYVCGSLKEEFGLALVEAMAIGLPVVAPDHGGPATYIEDGVTGFLVDTRSPRAVADGLACALELTGRPGAAQRAAQAREMVHERFTLTVMARTLSGVYAGVGAPVAG